MSGWNRVMTTRFSTDSYTDNTLNSTDYNTPYYDTGYEGYTEKEYKPLDYTVVSVGIMTLGLIVVVELIRHQLDHAALGRPFYKTVLQGVYSELATLGIVEFGVFLLQKYYEGLDKERKGVFGDVHFALFYTTIFNAFQSVLLAMVVARTSDRLWVQTEQVELAKYVRIRESFEKTQAQLYHDLEDSDDNTWNWRRYSLSRLWKSLRNPGLRQKYMKLLVQVRFHQLRIHFLEGNELPLNFKVSEYLKRSEQGIMHQLVHISEVAWLLLTGGLNLIYFLMGMVAFVSKDQVTVGTSLTSIFFGSMFFFIFVSLILYVKMRNIFRKIITKDHHTTRDQESLTQGMEEQLSLFWGGDPENVIGVIQFMQFCYALGLSIILMYWPSLDGEVAPYIYLAGVLLCYTLFLKVMAEVIPQYTLCTSLGQLVNQKHLQEAMALHRLQEHQEIKQQKQAEASIRPLATEINESSNGTIVASPSMGSLSSHESSLLWSGNSSIHQAKLAELVKMDTGSLRDSLPLEVRQMLMKRDQDQERRRKSRRSLSDGVSSMRNRSLVRSDTKQAKYCSDDLEVHNRVTLDTKIQSSSSQDQAAAAAAAAAGGQPEDTPQQVQERRRRERRNRRSISAPDTVASWRSTRLAEATIPETEDADDWEIGSIPGDGDEEPQPNLVEDETILPKSERSSSDEIFGEAPDSSISQYTPPALSPDSVDMVDNGPNCFQRLAHDLEPSAIRKHLKAYYSGDLYPTISHIFGTSVCFFLIGMRVESILSATDVIDPSNNTWEMTLGASYWMEFGMYGAFLVNALLILILLAPTSHKNGFSRVAIVAAVMDILLTISCMVVLYRSEVLRCSSGTEEDECPDFGSRTEGGLGNVEPFTSLIALRVFRFAISNYLIKKCSKKDVCKPSTHKGHANGGNGHGGQGQGHGATGGHGSMQEESGTALELWERAVKKYPDIVKEHGEFSGELFQAMLGLDVKDDEGAGHAGPH